MLNAMLTAHKNIVFRNIIAVFVPSVIDVFTQCSAKDPGQDFFCVKRDCR